MFDLSSLRNETFSWQAALSLGVASNLAYETPATIDKIAVGSWGFGKSVLLSNGDTQGFVALTGDVILIAFRGTQSIGDWFDNLDVLPQARPYGKVHSGFLEAYRRIEADLRAALQATNLATQKIWLTGHSLGGAIATVAAAELKDLTSFSGIYTYGQPRLGDMAVHNFFDEQFPGRFMRFVNNNDVVPRVPPGYQHVGRLVHFDADGNVEQAVSEAEAARLEPPPLTESEFKSMQAEIHKIKSALSAQQRSDRDAALDVSIEGIFPSLTDHRVERYIAILQRHASSMSSALAIDSEIISRSTVEGIERDGGPAAAKRRSDIVPALIRLKSPKWRPPAGLRVGAQIGNIVSANGSLDVLKGLATDPEIDSIEISREAGRRELASSVPFVGGDKVHRPPLAEAGDAAIVGVIDTGIDVLHEAFQDAQGNCRILAVWDQTAAVGPSPNAVDATAFSQTNGTLYLAAQIQSFITGGAPVPPALRDPSLHGTHVASIAAGRATGALADGMAPDAKIVVVIPKMRTNPGDPVSVGYSTSHFDALVFLKRIAQGGTAVCVSALPMAVNISLGMNAGAHDGSSLLEASCDSLTRMGSDPGFVIVKSAGNERGFGGHARFLPFVGTTPLQWESDNTFRFQDYMELWYQGLDELEFTLVDPAGHASATVSKTAKTCNQALGGNVCKLELTERCKDNGDNRLTIEIYPQAAAIQPGLWSLNVTGTNIRSRTPFVDIWVERDDASRAVRFQNESPEITLSIPGTAATVVTVAACLSATPMRLTPSSSYGLTRDGRPKPDVCAPGLGIIAAKAGEADHRATIAETGTSMAAPHVTGAFALAFSHRQKQAGQPQHNARQLISAVNKTAKFSSIHNPGAGYGMLDAEALFNLLI